MSTSPSRQEGLWRALLRLLVRSYWRFRWWSLRRLGGSRRWRGLVVHERAPHRELGDRQAQRREPAPFDYTYDPREDER